MKGKIITVSPAMEEILETVRRIAPTDAALLIEGESGTGKELIARALHVESTRRTRSFISENCAACPTELLEAEFFGVERGAFTGASTTKAGIFERVGGGTLFLDEVGEMDLSLQVKLLRVLQEREVRRVGGKELIPVDFRLVSATNRSLEDEVERKNFRLDLLYRLEVVRIRIPPLRERVADIPRLAQHFLELHATRLGRETPDFHPDALALLLRYPWPGNVRELQNEMWRAVALGYGTVRPPHLSPKLRRLDVESTTWEVERRSFNFQEAEREILGAIMRAALRCCDGNASRAARLLELPKSSFYRKLRRYGVLPERALTESPQPITTAIANYRHLDRLLAVDGSRDAGKAPPAGPGATREGATSPPARPVDGPASPSA